MPKLQLAHSPILGRFTFENFQAPQTQTSPSIRSIPAFCDTARTRELDEASEGGAEIPDIPLSRRGVSSAPVDKFPELPPRHARRPGFIPWSDSKRHQTLDRPLPRTPTSPAGFMEHDPKERVVSTPDIDHIYDHASSSSPASTTPKSLMSKSSRSRLNSSDASSLMLQSAPSNLPALQARAITDHDGGLQPLAEEEIDPASFDLVVPAHAQGKQYSLETQSERLFSSKHLAEIFKDPLLLQRFTNFIYQTRPQSIPILQYYMDALKALKAIEYANAVVSSLSPVQGQDFTSSLIDKTVNQTLSEKANTAFESLANYELPAYITHTYIQTVSLTVKRRIADTLPMHLMEMSDGLAEVFCLTDPSRPDNPIVFASEEFHKTTQYGMSYVLGRNCRFLQGPKTNPFSVRRIREKLEAGQEHCETFLNYRRDGSPFMNLLMVAPLYDSRGVVRYHIGAQVDVSGLVKDCSGLDSLERLMRRENKAAGNANDPVKIYVKGSEGSENEDAAEEEAKKDEFHDLASMFSLQELKTVREAGGSMHRIHQAELSDTESVANWHKPRLHIRDDANMSRRDSDPVLQTMGPNVLNSMDGGADGERNATTTPKKTPGPRAMPTGGRLSGVYEHYLLVRPYPSLRILFASPSLRVPGMLQSSLMARVGGISPKVRDALTQAFADGHGVTAKVRWMPGHVGAAPTPTATQRAHSPAPPNSNYYYNNNNHSHHHHSHHTHSALNGLNVASTDFLDMDPFDGAGETPHHQQQQAPPPQGRARWLHCTPLLGSNGAVGVWMVVLVDDEADTAARLARDAPPVAPGPQRRRSARGRRGSNSNNNNNNNNHHTSHHDSPPYQHRNGGGSGGGGGGGVMSDGEDAVAASRGNRRSSRSASVSAETGSLRSFAGGSDVFTMGDGSSARGRGHRRTLARQPGGGMGFLDVDSDRETIDTMRLDY